ncbi:MAG: flagellar hook-length control protein FliK [Bradyrhizobium sp.]|jgi:hypothetical protein
MPISIIPILPTTAAQSAAPDLVLEPGSVVNAQVVKVLSDNSVRIAISNVLIDVLTEVPLVAGQPLQLAVSQTESGIRLAVVAQGLPNIPVTHAVSLAPDIDQPGKPLPLAAPSLNTLTPLERAAVSAAARSAAGQQESLSPLFANLSAAVGSSSLPAKLQQAVMQVLAQRTSFDPALTGSDVKNAFERSGIFLEASLASGSVSPGSGVPDLKAALIVLRQTLATTAGLAGAAASSIQSGTIPQQPASPAVSNLSVAPVPLAPTAPSLVPSIPPQVLLQALRLPRASVPVEDEALHTDSTPNIVLAGTPAKAGPGAPPSEAALKLLAEMLSPMESVIGKSSALSLQNAQGENVSLRTNTPPPPFRGALPSAQAVAAPSIDFEAPLATSAHRLLGDTEAAIARQTLLQVASLPDRADSPGLRTDPVAPRWNFEIPFATAQGTAMAQFEISRDGGADVEAATRVWRARFSLDVEPAGPVHALVSLNGERTSVRLWAERPATAAQLRAGAAQLSQALGRAELLPGEIVIRDGVPPAQSPARAGHFVDRAL